MTFTYHPASPPATEIAARLNLHRSRPGEFRGRCPSCGYGSDAFSLSERRGRVLWRCASCGDQAAITAAIRSTAGLPAPAERQERLPRHGSEPAARIARAGAVWSGAQPIEPDSPAELYLHHRRISHVAASLALRWRPDCPHPSGGRRIALLAAVTGPDGSFAGMQRIFLDRDGRKADVVPMKASLGVIAGGAVRLADPVDGAVVVAEGVETSAAAGALLSLPAWSAISAGNMARTMTLPSSIRSVTIAADHDEPGLRAAEDAWRRWRAEGRECRIVKPAVQGKDFNDLQRQPARGGVR